jgi:phage tail-like protein
MATTKDVIKTSYPLPSYNYRVSFGSDSLSFSEVTGLNIEYEKVIYKHGFSFLMGANIIRAQRNEILITLRRGVVAKRNNLYEWLTDKTVKDISIDLCDEKGNPVVRWKVSKAQPFKLEGPSFNAIGSEIAIESIELVAHEITIEYL